MFKLIVAVFPEGKLERIMPAVKEAGIFGATMLKGRGLAASEAGSVLGYELPPSRDVLFIVTLQSNKDRIVNAIKECGDIGSPGAGIVFVADVDEVFG